MITPSKPDSKADSEDLTALSPKDKPWTRHRSETDKLQVELATSTTASVNYMPERYASRMFGCSQSLSFNVFQDQGGLRFQLYRAKFCRVPICPICQWRKSLKWTARFIEGFTKLVKVYPKHQYLFLTLTVRNCPVTELRTALGKMNKAWQRLAERKEFKIVEGYIRSLEITRNPETGKAHPHYHCLLMVPLSYFSGREYLSQARWTQLWRESLGLPPDCPLIVNVKKVKPKVAKNHLDGQGTAKTPLPEIINGIVEVCKYTVKVDDLLQDIDWTIKMADQIYKLRRVVMGGVIKKFINDTDLNNEDLINITEDKPLEIEKPDYDLIFDWYSHVQKYLNRS